MTATTDTTVASPALVNTVLSALATVRDPELDEPITTLGFVASCAVSGEGRAVVRLRLPTYFCAPNFAFLMVADAYDAVTAVPGITSAEVILEDHFASDAINQGVAAQSGFVKSFDGEAVAELGDLRAQFLRKAVMAGTDQVCRPLLNAGVTPAELRALTLGAVPATPEMSRLRQRRTELGLPAADDAPLLIDPLTGARVDEAQVPLHLRKARVTRAGIEANTSICSGMLRVRYPGEGMGCWEIPAAFRRTSRGNLPYRPRPAPRVAAAPKHAVPNERSGRNRKRNEGSTNT